MDVIRPVRLASGPDVAALELDRFRQPSRARLAADQHEQRDRRDLLCPARRLVAQGERLELIDP
jgi:hypothetical protein